MKSRFLQLFELYPDAMVIVDRAGQIHQANSQAEELFGYEHHKLRGESVQTLFPGQSVTLSSGAGPGDDAGSAGQHLDLVGSSSDLRQFPADVNVIPIQTERGTSSVMSIRDITEIQRAQFVLDLGLNFEEAAGRDRQDLLDHLIRAQEEERGRIAADIHDDTLQVLAAANLRIQQIRAAVGGCLVRIVDDGVGHSPAEVEERRGHAGLTLIRERAEIAGGWSRIESAPGYGTTVEFWVPNHGLPEPPKAGHERVA